MRKEPSRLAEQATVALGLDYAGVDLIEDQQGQWWVIEINGIPAWQGLQQVSEVNIADCLIKNCMG